MALNGGTGGSSAAIRAGAAYVELFTKDIGVKTGLKAFEKAFSATAAVTGRAGVGAIAAGTAVLGPIVAVFKDVIDRGDQFQKAADRLGSTSEALSALGYAAQQSGASLEDVETGAKHLYKAIAEGKTPSSEAAKAFSDLGLSAESLGSADLPTQFEAIADGLKGVTNPADRTALALKLLGKNGLQLMPMLLEGGAGLKDLLSEAADVGAIVSTADAQNAVKIGDSIDRSWTAGKNAVRALGAAILPQADQIDVLSRTVVRAAATVRQFVNDNRQMVLGAVAVGAGLIAAGSGLLVFSGAMTAASFVAGGLATAVGAAGAVIGFVATPVGALAVVSFAAAAGLGYLFATSREGQAVFRAVAADASQAAGTIRTTWGGIADAVRGGDIQLAIDVAMKGANVIVAQAALRMQSVWNDTQAFFVDGWHDAIYIASLAINDWSSWVAKAAIDLGNAIARNVGGAIKDQLTLLAYLADAAGAVQVAANLNASKAAVDILANPKAAEFAKNRVEEDRLRIEKAINDIARQGQEARDAARSGELATRKEALDAAQKELEYARLTAAFRALRAGGPGQKKPEDIVPDPQQFGGSKGVFAAAVYGQALGGSTNIPAQQLKAANEGNKLLGKLIDAVKEIPMMDAAEIRFGA